MDHEHPLRASPRRSLPLLWAFSLFTACQTSRDKAPDTAAELPGNVLILLTDDIGVDKTAAYGEQEGQPRTPNITALAEQGVRFTSAYAMPTCSPTRASLLTGRYPTRHGAGRWIYPPDEAYSLADDELTIPELLAKSPQPWSTAAVGKWHLTGFLAEDPAGSPGRAGFGHFAGSLANPLDAVQEGNTPRSYENWEKATDGQVAWTTVYMTTDTIDDAIALVQQLPEPWLLYVAPNAAHTPLHAPPEELLHEALPADPTELEMHTAMVEVLDDGIGRLMDAFPDGVRERTTVIYTSDNGTANEVDVIEPPFDPARAKGTVFEGGVRVPLIVTGPLVEAPGTTCDALVSVVDILPTVAEIAGVDVDARTALDGASLAPYLRDPDAPSWRKVAFAEQFYPNGSGEALDWRDRMVRDRDWKLIQFEWLDDGGNQNQELHFFRMVPGAVDEGEDLLAAGPLDAEAHLAYARLMAELTDLDSALVYGSGGS